jgi:hypothetical protein
VTPNEALQLSAVHGLPSSNTEGGAGAALQDPTAPATLHDAHGLVQGSSQHTPVTQYPDEQTVPPLHADPLSSFATHAPALQ